MDFSGGAESGNEAYTLYLRARAAVDRGDEASLVQAIADAEQALALDPKFVQADEILIAAHTTRVISDLVPGLEGWQRVKIAAERTLALDSESAEGHRGLAQYYGGYEYDWPRVDEELARARALNPGNFGALISTAEFAFPRGRYEEARQFTCRARLITSVTPAPERPWVVA